MNNKVIFSLIGFIIVASIAIIFWQNSQKEPQHIDQTPINLLPEVTPSYASESNQEPNPIATDSTKSIPALEVEQHSTRIDCWLIISGKVYDLTKLITKHPQGDLIAQGCSADATKKFKITQVGSQTLLEILGDISEYYLGEAGR